MIGSAYLPDRRTDSVLSKHLYSSGRIAYQHSLKSYVTNKNEIKDKKTCKCTNRKTFTCIQKRKTKEIKPTHLLLVILGKIKQTNAKICHINKGKHSFLNYHLATIMSKMYFLGI